MSPEDIWPTWLSNLFRQSHGIRLFHQTVVNERTGTHEKATAQRLNMRVPLVCKPCNTTWMSRAEQAVKPILVSLINNPSRERPLSRPDRQAIALWIAIKAVILDHLAVEDYKAQPKPFFSPQQRTAMRLYEQPPNRISVYVARIPTSRQARGDYKTMYYSDFPARAEKHLRAFAVTISANEVVIQLIASKMVKPIPLVPVPFGIIPRRASWETYAPQIWPDIGDVSWPPFVTTRRFDTLAYRIGALPD